MTVATEKSAYSPVSTSVLDDSGRREISIKSRAFCPHRPSRAGRHHLLSVSGPIRTSTHSFDFEFSPRWLYMYVVTLFVTDDAMNVAWYDRVWLGVKNQLSIYLSTWYKLTLNENALQSYLELIIDFQMDWAKRLFEMESFKMSVGLIDIHGHQKGPQRPVGSAEQQSRIMLILSQYTASYLPIY